jgi:hypothetical protein
MVLTSEGKTRKNADGSKARWCRGRLIKIMQVSK